MHTADERDDFFDYLEIPWTFSDDGWVKPSARWDRDLDRSGYVRLIYGYRFGLPLLNKPVTTTADGLPAPRRAWLRTSPRAGSRRPR